MFRRFKHWVGRAAFRILRPVLRGYLTGTKRVRVVLLNDKGEFLMIKNWLGEQEWGLPGGAVKDNEDAKTAALRELREETGVEIDPESLGYIGTLKHDRYGFLYTYDVFMAKVSKQNATLHRKHEKSTIALKWMSVHDLEESPHSQEAFDLLLAGRSKL